MNSHALKFVLISFTFALLSFCPIPIFIFTLIIPSILCAACGHLPSVNNLARTYAILPAPYFLFLSLSFLLDILRSYLSNFQVPWLRIVVLEGLASALLLYRYFRLSITHSVCTSIYRSYVTGTFASRG